nr:MULTISPECIES: acetyl-CoA carboxylase biotin carboxyl carrier protein subunit [unclassified Xanthobacter]
MSKTSAISEVSGSVWQVLVAVGDSVEEHQELMVIESMKMEIPVLAPKAGRVSEVLVQPADPVAADQIVAWIE